MKEKPKYPTPQIQSHYASQNNKSFKNVLSFHTSLHIHPNIPFLAFLSEATILYLSHNSLIVQNIRTYQQEIIWVIDNEYEIINIDENIVNYGPIKLAVLVMKCDEMYQTRILEIDWRTYGYRLKNQSKIKLNNYSNSNSNSKSSQKNCNILIKMDHLAQYLAVSRQDNLHLFNLNQLIGEPLLLQIKHPVTILKSFKLKKQPFFAFIYDCKDQNSKIKIPTNILNDQYQQPIGYYLKILHITSQISKKLNLQKLKDSINLTKQLQLCAQQQIIQLQFQQNTNNQLLTFVLTNIGKFYMFKISLQNKIIDIFVINIKLNVDKMKIVEQLQKEDDDQQIIKSMMNIRFMEDTEQVLLSKPTYFRVCNNRILFSYPQTRRLLYLTFSLLNYTNYSIYATTPQIFFPTQKTTYQTGQHTHNNKHYPSYRQAQFSTHKNTQLSQIKTQYITFSHDFCMVGLSVLKSNYRYIVIVDVLSSLMGNQQGELQIIQENHKKNKRIINGGQKIFGNFGIKGKCKSITYRQRQSSMLVLFENYAKQINLSNYLFDYNKLHKETPSSVLLWTAQVFHNPILHCVHPSTPYVLLIHSELCRIHYYTHQKLSQSTVNLNISNCQYGSYTPLGDKIVFCCGNLVWIVDAYYYQVLNIINVGLGLGGASISSGKWMMKCIQWMGWDKFVIECYGFGGTCFVQIENYKKARLLLQVSTNNQNIKNSGNSQESLLLSTYQNIYTFISDKIFQIDYTNSLLITFSGFNIYFYSLNTMEILNIFTLSQQPTCIVLNKQIQALFVGTDKGMFYIFKWPQFSKKKTKIKANFDQQLIAQKQIHKQKIVQIQITVNYRYIIIISESGEISIIQFLQQNSHNLSHRAILTFLKKSNNKPDTSITLTSYSCENQRTQMIVKAIGKQVQVNRKNQQLYEQLVQNFEDKVKQQKIQTQIRIKDEIETSEIEKRINNILRNIQKANYELNNMEQFKFKKIAEQNQLFDLQLLKIFKEKDQLQQILLNFSNQFQKEKKNLRSQLQIQKNNTLYAQQAQLSQTQKDTSLHKKLYYKMHSYNIVQVFKIDETKQESKAMIEYEFKNQLEELYEKRNNLQNSIRKYDKSIYELKQKITQSSNLISSLKDDLIKISQGIPHRQNGATQLQRQIKQKEVKNQELGIQNRNILNMKQIAEKKADFMQKQYTKLQTELCKLDTCLQQMQKNKQKLDDEFYEQNRTKIFLSNEIEEMKLKVIQLRQKRNKIKRQMVLKTTKISKSLHSINAQNQSVWKRNQKNQYYTKKKILPKPNNCKSINNYLQNSQQSLQNKFYSKTTKNWTINNKTIQHNLMTQNQVDKNFAQKIAARNYTSQKLDKLNKIKNDKIKKYGKINNKLINDHKRLISQLNELKRYNDHLIKTQQKLKQQIKNGSLSSPKKQYGLKKTNINVIKNRNMKQDLTKNLQNINNNYGNDANIQHCLHSNQFIQTYNNENKVSKQIAYRETIKKNCVVSLHQNGKITFQF